MSWGGIENVQRLVKVVGSSSVTDHFHLIRTDAGKAFSITRKVAAFAIPAHDVILA